MYKNAWGTLMMLGALIFLTDCSKSEESNLCDGSSSLSIADNICLSLEHGQLSNMHREIIEMQAAAGIESITALMPIKDLQIRIVDDPNLVIPEIGMGGYNPNPSQVILSINADFPDLDSTIEKHFIPLLAHEIHHAKRRRSVGYGNTLLQAVVSEGLADHFSIEVSGIAPPLWSVALSGNELQNWMEEASNSWNQPYNHGEWFLGTNPAIPRWAGYSIGFELVKNYSSINPNTSPSRLHNEPASSFEP